MCVCVCVCVCDQENMNPSLSWGSCTKLKGWLQGFQNHKHFCSLKSRTPFAFLCGLQKVIDFSPPPPNVNSKPELYSYTTIDPFEPCMEMPFLNPKVLHMQEPLQPTLKCLTFKSHCYKILKQFSFPQWNRKFEPEVRHFLVLPVEE